MAYVVAGRSLRSGIWLTPPPSSKRTIGGAALRGKSFVDGGSGKDVLALEPGPGDHAEHGDIGELPEDAPQHVAALRRAGEDLRPGPPVVGRQPLGDIAER